MSGNAALNITAPASGEGYVELWIPRDLNLSGNGGIVIPAHVHVIFYVDGNVKIAGNGVVNTSLIPGNVTLYGNHDTTAVQIPLPPSTLYVKNRAAGKLRVFTAAVTAWL